MKKETIENRYKVPTALWRKFTDNQRMVYNNIRAVGKMDTTSHPKAKISLEEWDTISHNFACYGAWESEIKTSKP